MKLFIILSFALLALTQAYPRNELEDGIHIPEKCSDVLAVKVCDRLDTMATQLKLKSEEVKNAVIDAYKQGKTKSEEVYNSAKEYLKQQVLTKKCEDLTTAENCQKLRQMAADLKIQADKVGEFVMKEIATLKTKECEDFLDANQCTQLKDVVGKLKIQFEKLQDIMVDAYLEAKTKAKTMIVETYNKVKDYVKATICEDMFNPGLCAGFRKYAEKTKVALPQIMETAYNLVKQGVAIGNELANKVYDVVDYFYDCTDVFDQSSCDRLNRWAATLKVTAQEVEVAVKKYVRIAMEKGTSIYTTIKDFVKAKIYCRFTRNCINSEDLDEQEDELSYGLFGDFKAKLRETVDKNFPNLEADVRERVDALIDNAKNLFDFLKKAAREIKTSTSEKFKEFLNKLIVMRV